MEIRKSTGVDETALYIARTVSEKLREGKKVFLALSGGSAIPVAVSIGNTLASNDALRNLSVMLTDERYGDVGHKDSNWAKLLSAGFLLEGAILLPTLKGLSFPDTVSSYENELERQFKGSDVCIGLFGMGSDGHTAGVLPKSDAVRAKTFSYGYETPQYTRITMTPRAIEAFDTNVLYAMGDEKKTAMLDLQKELSVDVHPAQALKRAETFVVFTDAL